MKFAPALIALFLAVALAPAAPAHAWDLGPRLAPGDRAKAERPHKPRYDSKRVERSRTENGQRKTTTWTRGDKSVSRDAVVERNGDSRTRDVTYTGAQGRQATAKHTRTRTEDGHTTNSVFTDRQGRQATRDANFARNDNGWERDVTYTGRDGQERTVDDELVRGDKSRQRTTTYTNAQGDQATRQADAYWDEDSQTWVREISYERDND